MALVLFTLERGSVIYISLNRISLGASCHGWARLDYIRCKSRWDVVCPLCLKLMSPLKGQVLMGQCSVMRLSPQESHPWWCRWRFRLWHEFLHFGLQEAWGRNVSAEMSTEKGTRRDTHSRHWLPLQSSSAQELRDLPVVCKLSFKWEQQPPADSGQDLFRRDLSCAGRGIGLEDCQRSLSNLYHSVIDSVILSSSSIHIELFSGRWIFSRLYQTYHEVLNRAHRPHQSYLSFSYCTMRSILMSEWESSMVLGFLLLLQKLFRTYFTTLPLSRAQSVLI